MSYDPQVCPAGRIPTCMLVDTLWGMWRVTYLSMVRERSGRMWCSSATCNGTQ